MKGKLIFITGSSIGIGRETAYKFAQEGCKLIITYYKDKSEGEKTLKKCMELGAKDTMLIQLDVTDNQSVRDSIKKITDKYAFISILINNAGVVVWKPLAKQSAGEIEAQIRTNLEGLIKVTKECLPYIKDMVINISSGAGKSAFAELTAYCATKFGVRGFTQALAQETKLKVYCVNPDMTKTRMTGFKGRPAEEVAEIILNTAKEKYKLHSGDDVDVWKYV